MNLYTFISHRSELRYEMFLPNSKREEMKNLLQKYFINKNNENCSVLLIALMEEREKISDG